MRVRFLVLAATAIQYAITVSLLLSSSLLTFVKANEDGDAYGDEDYYYDYIEYESFPDEDDAYYYHWDDEMPELELELEVELSLPTLNTKTHNPDSKSASRSGRNEAIGITRTSSRSMSSGSGDSSGGTGGSGNSGSSSGSSTGSGSSNSNSASSSRSSGSGGSGSSNSNKNINSNSNIHEMSNTAHTHSNTKNTKEMLPITITNGGFTRRPRGDEKQWKTLELTLSSASFITKISDTYACLSQEKKLELEEKLFDIEGQIKRASTITNIYPGQNNIPEFDPGSDPGSRRRKVQIGSKEELQRKAKEAARIQQEKIDRDKWEKENNKGSLFCWMLS